MFTPINVPPTEHHQFSTGHSTENGDNAKTVGEKVNAGFKHVYDVLRGLGATLADEIEYVAKSEYDALLHEFEEHKAELNNIKMMLQGLGFAGTTITNPGAAHQVTAGLTSAALYGKLVPEKTLIPAGNEPVVTVKPDDAAFTIGKPEGSEPAVKVTEL